MAIFLNRLERFLYYLLLFSIPFQTRKILYYSGWRFDEWQSISVYLTDVILSLLVLFWIYNLFYSRAYGFKLKLYDYFLFIFVIISAVSIRNSSNVIISWFQLVKLVEFIIFFLYLRNYAISRFGFANSLFVIFYGGIFQACIAIIQFLKQSDVGLRYLGESIFSADFKGIAAFYDFYGDKIIRAYGTTPHPNVLAVYLLLAIFSFYFIWLYKNTKYENILFYFHLVITWALFYTFARVSIFALGANYVIRGCLSVFKFPNSLKKEKVLKLLFFTAAAAVIFTILYWPEVVSRALISGDEEAVQLRGFYNRESVKIISWTGTGIGDFVNELAIRDPMLPSYLYQPVHNIYLLIYAETGVLGIMAFAIFLTLLIRDFVLRTGMKRFHHYSVLLLFSSFLFMGLFDHFLWTIQQGRLVLWLMMAAMAVEENEDIS